MDKSLNDLVSELLNRLYCHWYHPWSGTSCHKVKDSMALMGYSVNFSLLNPFPPSLGVPLIGSIHPGDWKDWVSQWSHDRKPVLMAIDCWGGLARVVFDSLVSALGTCRESALSTETTATH